MNATLRMTRAAALALSLCLALAAPVLAVKPSGGCPNTDFDDVTLQELIDLLVSRGALPDELAGVPLAFDIIDANDDGIICTKITPRPGSAVNAVDNTSHSN